MKRFSLIHLILFQFLWSFSSLAQTNIKSISGQVIDADSNEPMEFVSIYLKGQTIGTTTNEEGKFVFHLPSSSDSDFIVVSMIGYETVEKSINQFDLSKKIFLSSKITDLNQVVISSTKKKKLSARQIVKKAYRSIEANYPTQKYILEGFVRDLQVEDDNYIEYLECAAKFRHQPQTKKLNPEVELVEIRSNYISKNIKWTQNWDRKNSIMDLIEDDFIRFNYGPIKGKRRWKYDIEDVLLYNGGYVYKITAKDKPYQSAVLYIDTESFAFVRMELTRKAKNGKSWKRRLSNGQLQVYYNVIFEYQEFEGKMYLKYQKEEDTWEIYDTEDTKKLLVTKNPKKELFINKIITSDIENYPFTGNMRMDSSLEKQTKDYNSEFWSNYNAPRQTEELSKIEEYLKGDQK